MSIWSTLMLNEVFWIIRMIILWSSMRITWSLCSNIWTYVVRLLGRGYIFSNKFTKVDLILFHHTFTNFPPLLGSLATIKSHMHKFNFFYICNVHVYKNFNPPYPRTQVLYPYAVPIFMPPRHATRNLATYPY